jgi:hypothetical protein
MKVYAISEQDEHNWLYLKEDRAKEVLFDFISESDIGSKFDVKVVEMTELEFNKLPEWEG